MITKELIASRAAQLQRQAEKLQSDLNATLGAIQDCNYWLAQLNQPETNVDPKGGSAQERPKP